MLREGSKPLHFSSRFGHLSVVEYLVNQKADINSNTKNVEFLYLWTPLHFAAQNGHLVVVEYLVNQKADINSNTKNVGFEIIIILLFIMLLIEEMTYI